MYHQQVTDAQSQSSSHSPLSPQFPPHVPSPPPAAANIRRHQSLTAATGHVRRVGASGLRRSGTLQAQTERHGAAAAATPSPPGTEEDFAEEETQDGEEFQYAVRQPNAYGQAPGQYTPNSANSVGRSSPWSVSSSNEWKYPTGASSSNTANTIEDVQRALSQMEISGSGMQGHTYSQSSLPPRLNQHGSPAGQMSNMRLSDNGNTSNLMSGGLVQQQQRGGKLQLATGIEGGKGAIGMMNSMQPIGHNAPQQGRMHHRGSVSSNPGSVHSDERVERILTSRSSNPNLQYNANYDASGLPPNPPIPAQYQQGAQGPRLGVTPFSQGLQGQGQGAMNPLQQGVGFMGTPIDVPSLIALKGYNPASFDCRPAYVRQDVKKQFYDMYLWLSQARYFVIKSYTEDDVHKSLKYEIWSSTDPGNKRLDKAFKENRDRGPIYLFFSVNTSGHFCGMAEILTPVRFFSSSSHLVVVY